MDYQKIYDQIIERAKTRVLDSYKEKHHIIPKCIGGNNKKENIVELTAREHFLCHWLLYRIYPFHNGLAYSFWIMSNRYIKDKKQTSKSYQEAREAFCFIHKNRIITQETKDKISKAKIGKLPPVTGKKYSEESKKKQSLAKIGIKQSKETCNKKSKTLTGIKKSKEHSNNISKAKMGEGNHMFGIKGKNNKRSKPVIQYDLNMNFIKEWENGGLAAIELKISYSSLNSCCNGKIKTSSNYIWKFK